MKRTASLLVALALLLGSLPVLAESLTITFIFFDVYVEGGINTWYDFFVQVYATGGEGTKTYRYTVYHDGAVEHMSGWIASDTYIYNNNVREIPDPGVYKIYCEVNAGLETVGMMSREQTVAPNPEPVLTVTLNKYAVSVAVGKTVRLSATVLPKGSVQTVVWTSSNPAVATVGPDGKVTGRSVGTATVTATATGGASAGCQVTVKKK